MNLIQRILSRLTRSRNTSNVYPPPKPVSRQKFVLHLGMMVGLLFVGLLFFFIVYLPFSTNHNDTVEVPKVTGKKLDDIQDVLDDHDLRYEVQDSDYVSHLPPLTVVDQFPKAGSIVKEDRKIFVTVVAQTPPMVEMPNMMDYSLRSAQATLQSFGLTLGRVTYKPDSAHRNAVIAQQYNGKNIEAGTRIPHRTKIDIILGDGGNAAPVILPNLIGKTVGDAESILIGLGLIKGTVTPDDLPGNAIVKKQEPAFSKGRTIAKGQRVNLWLSPPRPRPVRVAAPDSTKAPKDSIQ